MLKCENISSRKTFVGGMMKAAYFLQGDRAGTLVFVMVPKDNTTATAIAKHLKPYLEWVMPHANLRTVYIIEAKHYYQCDVVMKVGSRAFKKVILLV
ncbi:MAG: hypothetical protein P0Y53_09965 [Candidatus Pseudobacter hemicellulosilyticus]|uniref:Uncharacterized protein n=1 Tax=Candidatus Pseudobacter hemicellulosilyticus TaxID=3121375 RepID=A0AAJ5WWE0_9BACT|nr:MAG: hypothetical protein P0Y53_09965 [Pseudobacter sp.]